MIVEVGTCFPEPFQLNNTGKEGLNTSEDGTVHNTEENIDNISPVSNGLELMVAVKPTLNYNQSTNQKLTVAITNKETLERSFLLSKNIVSPIKRPFIEGLTGEAPNPKRTVAEVTLGSIVGVQNDRHLSQSVGNSSKLQSAIRRVQTNLSQSCFADLCSNRSNDIDNDLTCLNWLQEGNLLNGLSSRKKSDQKEIEESTEKEDEIKSKELNEGTDLRLNLSDPLKAISEVDKSLRKPAYSFSTLIFMAIENAKDKRLPVKEIYQWIQYNFPYFQKAPIGWKNSVRHNLSLNKSFKKVDKEKCIGKGSLWTIDHEARAGLVQQLRKTATYHSYPYSKLPYSRLQYSRFARFYTKDTRTQTKRDSSGRFIPNHDDAEVDVAATMCSLSSPASLYRSQSGSSKHSPEQQQSSLELLKIWRTHIEPNYDDDEDMEDGTSEENSPKKEITDPSKPKFTIEDFLEEVHSKLSFKPSHNKHIRQNTRMGGSLNTSLDEDYEFYNSEDESSDEDDEMSENMRRLVEKDREDECGDSGYSEECTLRSATMLDHSYSKSIQSLCKPQSKRESKGVAALLSLANAASKELENLCKDSKKHSIETSKCNTRAKKHLNLIKTKSSMEGIVST